MTSAKQATTFARRLIVAIALIAALTSMALIAWRFAATPSGLSLQDTWQAHGTTVEVATGRLGNTPVRIPAAFAKLLEYDDDPGLFEARQKAPVRTSQSPIRSFGFDILYPEMLGVTPATQARRQQATIETTMWLHVSLLAGSRYQGDDFLQLKAADLLDASLWKFPLKAQTGSAYALSTYTSEGGDPQDFRHQTIHVHRDEHGQVDAYIECQDTPRPSASCTLYSTLPTPMKASLRIQFRRALLPQWQPMRQAVMTHIQAFSQAPT